jgi:hypothetical protein
MNVKRKGGVSDAPFKGLRRKRHAGESFPVMECRGVRMMGKERPPGRKGEP